MKCKNCGESIIHDYSAREIGSWSHYRAAKVCTKAEPEVEDLCDGMCVTGSDIGIPGPGIAYPHPGCPAHAPDEVCQCGMPDRCMSPTHGQIDMREALEIRHRQSRDHQPTLVTSEALMFAEKAGIPWPEERPYEQALAPDEVED